MTEEQSASTRKPRPVAWYRTPLEAVVRIELHERSDFWGGLQTFGYLGTLLMTGGLAFYSAGRWPWAVTLLLTFLHGTCFAFQINAVHELGHGTVFKTRWLNRLFEHVFGFLGWINFHVFDTSHVRHHQFTLHPPDDLEVVLPVRLVLKQFWRQGFFCGETAQGIVAGNLRLARGEFVGEWELKLFPPGEPDKRRPAIRWSRMILAGHGLIIFASLLAGLLVHPRYLMIAVLVSLAPTYGGWLFFSCNSTQHIGLQDHVPDFRLCCRTFVLNPIARFLYWHMNYHIEHHMYAAVPCYKLGKLHRLIRHDLAPCPHGLLATWREIAAIQEVQQEDPAYQHQQACPNPRPKDVDQRHPEALQPA